LWRTFGRGGALRGVGGGRARGGPGRAMRQGGRTARPPPGMEVDLTTLPTPGELARSFARSMTPRKASYIGTWLLLLLSFNFLTVPPTSNETWQKYYMLRASADEVVQTKEFMEAQDRYVDARAGLADNEVWFWRFRGEPYATMVPLYKAQEREAVREMRKMEKERDRGLAKARSVIGIFSERGLAETRDLFWQGYERAKVFATRQTFWQAFWNVIGRAGSDSDENIVGFLLKWAMILVSNFTFGLVAATITFAFSLGSLVWSFGPNVFVGILVYVVYLAGAVATVVGILGLLYGGIAASVYTVAAVAQNAQLQDGRRPRAPPRMHYE